MHAYAGVCRQVQVCGCVCRCVLPVGCFFLAATGFLAAGLALGWAGASDVMVTAISSTLDRAAGGNVTSFSTAGAIRLQGGYRHCRE